MTRLAWPCCRTVTSSCVRDAGKLANLVDLVASQPVDGKVGIGHTRWATHGEPSARNAHPHASNNGKFVVVHNGIVENFLELREELSAEGAVFNSDTDTETIVHLIDRYYAIEKDLSEAVRKALLNLRGAHGVVVMSSLEPDKIVAARIGNAGGVVIGCGEGEMFVASDIPAILEHTRKVIFLESGQMAVIQRERCHRSRLSRVNRLPIRFTPWPGIRWRPKRASTGTLCRKKSTNRCAR